MSEAHPFKRSRSASGSLSPRSSVPRLETSSSRTSADASLQTRINVRPDVQLHEPHESLSQREGPRPHSHNGALTSSPRGFAAGALAGTSTAINARPPSPGSNTSRRGSLLGMSSTSMSSPSQHTHLPSISSMLPPMDIRRPRSANLSRGGSPSGSATGMRPYGEGPGRPSLSYYASGSGSSSAGSGPLQPEFHRQRSLVDFPQRASSSSLEDTGSFAAYSAPYRANATSISSYGADESGSNTPGRASPSPLLPPPPPPPPSAAASYHGRPYDVDERDAKRPRLPETQPYPSSATPFAMSTESSSSGPSTLRRSSSLRSPPPADDYAYDDSQRDDARDEAGRSGRVLKRTYQACIRCRTKKLKCDSRLPRCTPCANAGTECQQADVRRQTSYPRGYVENLEEMCQVQERLLRRLLPNVPPSEYKALAADESRWRPGTDRPIDRR